MIIEARDEDFAALLNAIAPTGLRLPDEPLETTAVLDMLRGLAGRIRETFAPCAWMIVEDGEVVGLCSIVAPPADRAVDIGYGVTAARRGRGVATRCVADLVAWARTDPRVDVVRAETSVDNAASRRALERNGFRKTGRRTDPEDGELFCWRIEVGA